MVGVKRKFKFAVIATDVAIFALEDGQLQTLLIKMKKHPFSDHWAAPGGLIKPYESVDRAAMRVLAEKTSLKDTYLEQLYTFGRVNRDPFGRVVSVAYIALLPNTDVKIKTTKDHPDIKWFPVNQLPKLAYDHADILDVAIKRLQGKLEYTNIIYSLLPKEFTLTDLQNAYEIILGKKLDKRNFRKKIFAVNLVQKTDKREEGAAHRPASLYRFTHRTPRLIEVL